MRTLILLLFSLLPACGGDPSQAATPATPSTRLPRALLRTEGGYESMGPLGEGWTTFVAPRVSRSELLVRPAFDRRGVLLTLTDVPAPRVTARAVVHRPDQRVVLTREGAMLVDAPRLPAAVRGDTNLPSLARHDGNLGRGRFTLSRAADGPSTLVLLGGEFEGGVRVDGASHRLPVGPHGALVLADRGAEVLVELGEVGLDQAFFARVTSLNDLEELVARRSPDDPEVYAWTPPAVRADETWTLLIDVFHQGPPASDVVASPAAATSPAPLVDVTSEAGLDFVHLEGPDEQLDIRPTMGPGVAWGDVDGDGLVDLYLVQGSGRAGSEVPSDRLYRNLGGGRFEDVTAAAGLSGERGAGMGALLVDLDGDGDLDLYLANYGEDALYANDGQGRFEDVSAATGLEACALWSAGVCAADIEGDGDLDLYITSYLDYDPAKMPEAPETRAYQREDPLEMLPFAFPGERNRLLLNEGGLRFRDVAAERGLEDVIGRGMQAVFWDFDEDGDPDLYVANDVSPNVLFRNEGDGTFTDVSFATGLDDPRGGMGLAVGDVDGDGDEDLFLTNWQLEANALYQNQLTAPFDARHRRSTFHDGTVKAGLGPDSMGATSWGAVLLDLELDGDLDLFVANGYTSPDYEGTGICVGQPNHLFTAVREARFERVLGVPALDVELASRAVAGCDYDRDGDVDLVVSANNGRVQLLRNGARREGHWLGVRLRGEDGNTHGIGAEVRVTTAHGVHRRSMRAGTSYLGCAPAELHFGLGAEPGEVTLEVRWPWGETTEQVVQELDQWVRVERPR